MSGTGLAVGPGAEVLVPFFDGQVAAGCSAGVVDGVLEAGVPGVDRVVVGRDNYGVAVGPEVRGDDCPVRDNDGAKWSAGGAVVQVSPCHHQAPPGGNRRPRTRDCSRPRLTFTGRPGAAPGAVSSTSTSPCALVTAICRPSGESATTSGSASAARFLRPAVRPPRPYRRSPECPRGGSRRRSRAGTQRPRTPRCTRWPAALRRRRQSRAGQRPTF